MFLFFLYLIICFNEMKQCPEFRNRYLVSELFTYHLACSVFLAVTVKMYIFHGDQGRNKDQSHYILWCIYNIYLLLLMKILNMASVNQTSNVFFLYLCMCMYMLWCLWRSRRHLSGSQFSPAMWVPVIELRISVLATSAFTSLTTLPTL